VYNYFGLFREDEKDTFLSFEQQGIFAKTNGAEKTYALFLGVLPNIK
jgi:hypothetical protein